MQQLKKTKLFKMMFGAILMVPIPLPIVMPVAPLIGKRLYISLRFLILLFIILPYFGQMIATLDTSLRMSEHLLSTLWGVSIIFPNLVLSFTHIIVILFSMMILLETSVFEYVIGRFIFNKYLSARIPKIIY